MQGLRPLRLIQICHEIKSNPKRQPKELYKALGISKQQFYKDKTLLEKLGFKFTYSPKKKSLIIEQDSLINIYDLTLNEIFALVMSVRQLSSIGDYSLTQDALSGIRRIINQAPLQARGILQGALDDIVFKEGFGCNPKIIETLTEAIKENVRRIIITYDNYKRGEIVKYEFDPYTIFPRKNGLYVEGYSFTHKEIRMFRINRIKDIRFTQFTVPRRSDYSFKERHKDSFGVFTGNETTTVRIKFSKNVAKYIEEPPWVSRGKITKLTNGNILYEINTSYPQEALWWILQWGSEAEILEPEWLRGEVMKTIRGMNEMYSMKKDNLKNV
jgi:predicted DNA-binding transcriptional regulator YafY